MQWFNYVKCGVQDRDGDDAAEYQKVVDALVALGVSDDERKKIISILAGILWLGQVTQHLFSLCH